MLLHLRQFWNWVILMLLFLLLGLLPFGNSALAQERSPLEARNLPFESPMFGRLGLDPNNIPSEKVSQFVHACLQVVELIEQREGELQGAETESESLRVQQEIEAEALAIIEQAGLTRQEYLQLLGLANTDPEFGERIAVQLQEAAS